MNKEEINSMNPQEHASMHGNHKGHRLMMIACCIPIFVIAITLVATGVIAARFLVLAVACTLMMAMMMGSMNHNNSK